MTSGPQVLVQFAVERVINLLPEGLLIAAFAWLLLRIVGKQNSAARFAILFTALLAIAGIPFVPRMSGAVATVGHATPGLVTLPRFFALMIFGTWIFGVGIATIRLGVGLWRLGWLHRSCTRVKTSDLPPVARETLEHFQSQRAVEICTSPEVRVPAAVGFFKPVILLPAWALNEFSAEQLRIILLHEFAHLRRRDDWTNLIQKLVRTIFFFHPAVWWIEKRLSLERELACDNLVLAEEASPRAYAECLVSLAEKNFVRRGLEMAQAAIGRAGDTSLRLIHILDSNRPPSSRSWLLGTVLAMMTVFSALCLLVLPGSPNLISFQEFTPAVPVAQSSLSRPLPSVSQPEIKPVAMRINSQASARAIRRSKTTTDVPREQRVIPAVSTQRRTVPSVVMARATSQRLVAPRSVLLIMQTTTQINRQGSVTYVNFQIWRVTFVSPERNRTQEPALAKLS